MLKLPASEFKNPVSGLIVRVPASSFTMESPESEDGQRLPS